MIGIDLAIGAVYAVMLIFIILILVRFGREK